MKSVLLNNCKCCLSSQWHTDFLMHIAYKTGKDFLNLENWARKFFCQSTWEQSFEVLVCLRGTGLVISNFENSNITGFVTVCQVRVLF